MNHTRMGGACPSRERAAKKLSAADYGSRRPGENSCFPPYPFSALLAFSGAHAPSVGRCPTPRFLLVAKRKRKTIRASRGANSKQLGKFRFPSKKHPGCRTSDSP